ncbi:MAG: response regulator [Elusimicrobia bacterium]|nr:response regulator [Elusimicrobiota bacterium]
MAKRALIVEDDTAVARTLVRYLELRGWTALAALTPEAALRLFAPGRYELVICDINLNEVKDGLAVALEIRAQEAGIRIIMASGLPENLERARREGFQLCLPKPFKVAELYALVDG